jgi:hypothetical protein
VTEKDTLPPLPTRRVKAMDGMAVTADVWEEAHSFHYQHQTLHARYGHGAGVLGGLEVVASDPADTAIYIRPGVAIDASGQLIVLAEPLSYDVSGAADGLLYILLTYSESLPRPANGQIAEGAPMFVNHEYGLEAVTTLPHGPHVELARMRRSKRGAVITNARVAATPGTDELDLRFRRQAGVSFSAPAGIAVVALGGRSDKHARGAAHLAQALRSAGRPTWADENVPLNQGLSAYTLVYLVAYNSFTLSAAEMNALYAYLQGGGTVLAESCRREAASAAAAEGALTDMFSSLGLRVDELTAGHELLTTPALFANAPAGFETDSAASVRVGPGLIYSTADYGCLWQGERRSGAANREAIRSAHEFGGNLLAYAEARRQRA